MVSVILLIVRLAGGAFLLEKANVKRAVAVLGRGDGRCTRRNICSSRQVEQCVGELINH